jgi:hypothetical protein
MGDDQILETRRKDSYRSSVGRSPRARSTDQGTLCQLNFVQSDELTEP